ncbi:MAG: hypothetical protein WC635_09215 [Bacteriovorax sp.]|jgi:hypothetical protein
MHLFWKVTLSLMLISHSAFAFEPRVETLSDGACWFETGTVMKIASFNDKSVYSGDKGQIEAEFSSLISQSYKKISPVKIMDLNLALHCGAYGASLVARVTTDTASFCVWSRFEKGRLLLRSIGLVSDKFTTELCDGYKWGEFIMGINSTEFLVELQSPKWSAYIKEVKMISENAVKIILVKDYEFREQEVVDQLEQNFSGKNLIRYIEFNDYRHPVGEYIHLR